MEHQDDVGSVELDGFSCPLLLQISDEIRRRLPSVISTVVIFDALTIHSTDEFESGYENCRTNIMLLYGPPRRVRSG